MAFAEAPKEGPAKVIWDCKETNYDRLPGELEFSAEAPYAYICSNETIQGVQFWEDPDTGEAGRASVLRIYEQDGMPCAEVEHVFTTGNRYRYVLPFCRKDGEWKMAF